MSGMPGMSGILENSAKIAITGPAVGIYDLNQMPRMQNASEHVLANATPRKGLLSVTKIDMSNFDAAVASCSNLRYSEVQGVNTSAGVTSTETSCGWIQFARGGGGASILGTNDRPIGPMPAGATTGSKYYPPVLTKSSRDPWPNGYTCTPVAGGSVTCKNPKEGFAGSGKYAGVNDSAASPFLPHYPTSATTPLSRDKYIQVDTNAGPMVATLYQDSERGLSDPSLETRSSYSIFTTSMTNPGAQDTTSWQTAFTAFQPVGNDLPRPSRDISVFATNLEEHDFCAEMNEQTIINENNLPCLQREWVRKGGSHTDYNYPDARLYGTCYGRVVRR